MLDVPLFFMCSGFLAYKSTIDYRLELRKKTISILIPFILAVAAAALIRGINIVSIFTDITKSGYYFLQTLYEIFLLYWLSGFFKSEIAKANYLGGKLRF